MASQLEVGKGRNLWKYWVSGPGLARWSASPTPYRTLVAELGKERVPPGEIHGLAANIYRRVFNRWPGKHDKGDHGSTPGDKVAAAVNGK
jgi:hypothetical protein